MSDHGRCRSCRAPVIWALTPKGEKAPIDVAASGDGNTLLLRQSQLGVLSIVLSGDALVKAREAGVELRKNHWATCIDREDWRRQVDEAREAERVAHGSA